jgi:hypothetical protein
VPDGTYTVSGEVGSLFSFDVIREEDEILTLFSNESSVLGFPGLWSGDRRVDDATIEYTGSYGVEVSHGDLDSDGSSDVVFGAYAWVSVYVHMGELLAKGDFREGDVRIRSADTLSHFGAGTALGDLNGDGHSDLVVSAHDAPAFTSVGAVYVFAGPLADGLLDAEDAWAQYVGTSEGESVGWYTPGSLRSEDLTGDGEADLLIPSQGMDAQGRSWLVHAPAAGLHELTDDVPHLSGETIGIGLGYAAAVGTDLNGNGLPELLISATHSAVYGGAIYGLDLPLDPDTLSLQASVFAILGEQPADEAGKTLSTGDFDGDGRVDALIAATGVDLPGIESAGTVTLMLAGALEP